MNIPTNTYAKPLNDTEIDRLDDFLFSRIKNAGEAALASKENYMGTADQGVLGISELHGFFTSVASGPSPIKTEQWLPALWGDYPPEWKSEEHGNAMLRLLRRFKHEVDESLRTPGFVFDPCFNEREINGELEIVRADWCVGYIRGTAFLPIKGQYLNDEGFVNPTTVIKVNAPIDGVDVLAKMAEQDPAAAERLRTAVPEAARDLYTYWVNTKQEVALQPISQSVETGRNDPCPCGSGKKFKKCCLH